MNCPFDERPMTPLVEAPDHTIYGCPYCHLVLIDYPGIMKLILRVEATS